MILLINTLGGGVPPKKNHPTVFAGPPPAAFGGGDARRDGYWARLSQKDRCCDSRVVSPAGHVAPSFGISLARQPSGPNRPRPASGASNVRPPSPLFRAEIALDARRRLDFARDLCVRGMASAEHAGASDSNTVLHMIARFVA